MLFPDLAFHNNEDLFLELKKFKEEFTQIAINKELPEETRRAQEATNEGIKGMEEVIRMFKENPELASQSGINIAEMEAELARLRASAGGIAGEAAPYTDSRRTLSVNPSSLWHRLLPLAVNRKAYTAYQELGEGLFEVNEAPRFLPLHRKAFDKEEVPETSSYKWRFMDETGNYLTPAQYGRVSPRWDLHREADVIIAVRAGLDGKPKTGLLDWRCQVRVPFIYDGIVQSHYSDEKVVAMKKGGRIGWVDLYGGIVLPFDFVYADLCPPGWSASRDGKNYGIVSWDGEIVIPFKYAGYWGLDESGNCQMLRFDGKLDVYSENYVFLRTIEKPKED